MTRAITPEQTAEALEASIAKWKRNAEAKTPEEYTVGAQDCPLCLLFVFDDDCDGCPVMKKTGQDQCDGTPYYAARDAYYRWRARPDDNALATIARARALEMVAFLETCREEK